MDAPEIRDNGGVTFEYYESDWDEFLNGIIPGLELEYIIAAGIGLAAVFIFLRPNLLYLCGTWGVVWCLGLWSTTKMIETYQTVTNHGDHDLNNLRWSRLEYVDT